ncbi:MAG: hypothetical protein JNL10_08715 [Verrucomicrobiales bacterium]|nr:hypothetical protein [Verrucomicrobiales bacterium]
MPRSVKAVAVVVLTLSLGLHWALLQSVAWAGMIARYAQEDSLSTALAKTFDGRHACKLCRIVEAGRSAEKAPAAEVKLPKFEACAPVRTTLAAAELPAKELPERSLPILKSRTDTPLLPPPRRA